MPETIRVRPGEELPGPALEAYLREHLEGFTGGLQIDQFAGGHSNLTYRLLTPGSEYVLRRAPLGPVPPKAHDMAREYRVLRALSPVFPKAPRALLCCEDAAVIGATFYVMERRFGRTFRHASEIAGEGAAMSTAMVDTLTELHAIDVTQPPFPEIGKPEGFVRRQVLGWTERWERAKLDPLPELDAVVAYLNQTIPESGPPSVVHNDYKLDNLLFSADKPEVGAVLDWEMTTIGDPLADLGMALAYWQVGGAHEVQGQLPSRWLTREDFIERYALGTGRDLRHVAWHETLGLMKIAVILQQIYVRYVRGQTHDERFGRFGESVRRLAALAHRHLEKSN